MKLEDLQKIVFKALPLRQFAWWEKVLLRFRPTYAYAHPEIMIHFKTIFGKVYITNVNSFPEMQGTELDVVSYDDGQ